MIFDNETQRTLVLNLLSTVRALVADEGETIDDAAERHLAFVRAVREAKIGPCETCGPRVLSAHEEPDD